MSMTIPGKVTIRITARRLNGVIQPSSAIVIGLPSAITYDIVAMENGRAVEKTNVTPRKRPVSTAGTQVELEAADAFDEGTYEVLSDTDQRLFVRESIVFRDC